MVSPTGNSQSPKVASFWNWRSDAIVRLFNVQKKKTRHVSEYHPKNIGLSLSADAFDYEFVVCGKNTPYTQNQIINFFIVHGAMLESIDSGANVYENAFVLTLCCDLEQADLGPTEFAVQLRQMKFVDSADYSEMRGRLFGRLAGITFYNKRRALALDAATLINLGERLARETGASGAAALYEEGRMYAYSIVDQITRILTASQQLGHSPYSNYDEEEESEPKPEAYCMKCRLKREIRNPRQILLSNKSQALQGTCAVCTTRVYKIGAKYYARIRSGPVIENTRSFLTAAGWGIFELRTGMEDRFGSVTILDPPTMDGEISYGNQFTEGIAAGLLEKAAGSSNRMVLIGETFDQNNQTLRLHFAEKIRVTPPKRAAVLNRKVNRGREISSHSETRAISPVSEVLEVDRIIRSLEKIEADARTSAARNEGQEKQVPEQIIVDHAAPASQ